MMIGFYYNDEGTGYMFGDIGIGPATLKTFESLLTANSSRPGWKCAAHWNLPLHRILTSLSHVQRLYTSPTHLKSSFGFDLVLILNNSN